MLLGIIKCKIPQISRWGFRDMKSFYFQNIVAKIIRKYVKIKIGQFSFFGTDLDYCKNIDLWFFKALFRNTGNTPQNTREISVICYEKLPDK